MAWYLNIGISKISYFEKFRKIQHIFHFVRDGRDRTPNFEASALYSNSIQSKQIRHSNPTYFQNISICACMCAISLLSEYFETLKYSNYFERISSVTDKISSVTDFIHRQKHTYFQVLLKLVSDIRLLKIKILSYCIFYVLFKSIITFCKLFCGDTVRCSQSDV